MRLAPFLSIPLLTLLLPALALATPPRRIAALDAPKADSGPGLPIGCQFSTQDLVRAAKDMPAVRAAIAEFAHRGYVAIPAADAANNGCAQGVTASAVVLAYEKPGLSYLDDSTKFALPMIVVATGLHPVTQEPVTSVSGGIVVIDGVAQRFFTNQDLPHIAPSDPAFDVVIRSGGGPTGRLPASLMAEIESDLDASSGSRPYEIDSWSGAGKAITKWAGCTGAASWGCAVTSALSPGGILRYSTPAGAASTLGACMVGSGIGCVLGQLFD